MMLPTKCTVFRAWASASRLAVACSSVVKKTSAMASVARRGDRGADPERAEAAQPVVPRGARSDTMACTAANAGVISAQSRAAVDCGIRLGWDLWVADEPGRGPACLRVGLMARQANLGGGVSGKGAEEVHIRCEIAPP
jgi:hypothetical protein